MRGDSARGLFSVGQQTYELGDVIVAAIVRGDWSALEARLRQGLAGVRQVASGAAVAAADLEEAAREFRYSHDLLSVQDTEDWLERAGLTFEDWARFIERSACWGTNVQGMDQAVRESSIDPDEVRQNIYAEAVCSGDLDRFSLVLAGRAALHECALEEGDGSLYDPGEADLAGALAACAAALGPSGLHGVPVDARPPRVAAMLRLESCFAKYPKRSVTAPAVRAQIDTHRVEWIRVDWQYLDLASEPIACEAALCVREDGASLAQVAATARVSLRQETVLLEDVDSAARAALLAARPGDLLGPLVVADRFRVAHLVAKGLPTEEDARVRQRAQEQLVADLVKRERTKRVRWHDAS